MYVLTYNIRYDNPGDGINSWPNRRNHVAALIASRQPEVFGLQEALPGQVKDIAYRMKEYAWIGAGRDDGKTGGELTPVFYNINLIRLLNAGHFWLSESPEIPSRGWDAEFKRVCTWAKFWHNSESREFFLFNTHFDHSGTIAREESARLMIEKVASINYENLPLILTGDFNLTPDSHPIATIKTKLCDTADIQFPEYPDKAGTFNDFNTSLPAHKRIDYIFVNEKIIVQDYKILKDAPENRYPSDHFPVLVNLSFASSGQ